MDGWQQQPEQPGWHGEQSAGNRDRTVTDSASRLPATLSIAAIIAIVAAVIAIVVLHGGGESGIAVPAPATAPPTTRVADPDSVEIENPAARLSYRVPKSWTPAPEAAPSVLGVEFTGAASYAIYPCGGAEYSRAFATSAAVQSTSDTELAPEETAERFAGEFAGTYFPGARPGQAEASTAEIDGRKAVLVTLPLEIDAEDPECQATAGLVTVLAVDLDNATATTPPGLAMLVIVADTEGGPAEPVSLADADIRSIVESVRVD